MMDSDEDDIYPEEHGETNGHRAPGEVRMEDLEDGEEEGEEVEEESDDDVDFIIDADAKDEPPAEPPGSQTKRPSSLVPTTTDSVRKSSSTPTPAVNKTGSPAVAAAAAAADTRGDSQPPHDRPGTEYPARHTSKIDPNGNPVHPATGKPILSTDFDVDFPTDSSKPWRKPGADITDYFNYGFDEFTWASYCLKQQQMPKEVKEITQQAEQLKAFVEGIPGGGMPGAPGPGPGPVSAAGDMSQMAMPSEAQMQQMFAAMTSQGLDPSIMDPSQFMQFMAGGGAGMMGQPQPPTGPSGGFSGGGFDQGGGGGGFGRGRGKGGRRNW